MGTGAIYFFSCQRASIRHAYERSATTSQPVLASVASEYLSLLQSSTSRPQLDAEAETMEFAVNQQFYCALGDSLEYQGLIGWFGASADVLLRLGMNPEHVDVLFNYARSLKPDDGDDPLDPADVPASLAHGLGAWPRDLASVVESLRSTAAHYLELSIADYQRLRQNVMPAAAFDEHMVQAFSTLQRLATIAATDPAIAIVTVVLL